MTILNFLGRTDFQVAFWSTFLGTLIISLAAAFWLNRATDLFKKPKLTLVVKQNEFYRDTILLSERKDGDYEASFHLAIRNDGNQTLRSEQGYWHTYITETEGKTPFSVPGETNHQRDLIRESIYPHSFTDIGFEWKFKIEKENLKGAEVPYFFSTEYGHFPETVSMDSKTGEILFAQMSKIGYEIENVDAS
jgi:hypothetical protein